MSINILSTIVLLLAVQVTFVLSFRGKTSEGHVENDQRQLKVEGENGGGMGMGGGGKGMIVRLLRSMELPYSMQALQMILCS